MNNIVLKRACLALYGTGATITLLRTLRDVLKGYAKRSRRPPVKEVAVDLLETAAVATGWPFIAAIELIER